jgi:hypothetical protein
MSDAYIIEIDDLAAGIVQRERGGFRFRAAHPDFYRLECRLYATPWRAQRAAEELVQILSARRRERIAAPLRGSPSPSAHRALPR